MKMKYLGLTQKQIHEKIQEIADPYRPGKEKSGQEFSSDWLSDAFLARYYFCKENNIRPVKFKWVYDYVCKWVKKGPKGDIFHAYLNDELGWKRISYNKVVRIYTTAEVIEKEIKEIMREVSHEFYPAPMVNGSFITTVFCHYNITHTDHRIATDVHHESPNFKTILQECRSLITDEDIKNFNWGKKDCFIDFNSHPAVVRCRELHKTAIMHPICKDCHYTFAGKE